MKYKIVADSSCDLNEGLRKEMDIGFVPIKIQIDGKNYVDDENLDIDKMLYDMKNSETQVKTSSPSPGDFIEKYKEGDNIFVVTISSQLSGTYNAAVLAKNIITDSTEKFIHVFDSKSASIGETLVSMKVFELIQDKCDELDIVNKVEEYIEEMKTFFILENLDNLIKGGRMTKIAGHIASLLSIKPIMGSDGDGNIKLVDKLRGTKRAFRRLVEVIGEEANDMENKILGISHCNAKEKANKLKRRNREKL